ncbi:hypothetical protein EWM64_g10934, partial [Hericium alpestre]
MPVVHFVPFSSLVQPTLWHELTRLKLEVLRLSDETVPLTATYSAGRTIKDRNTGQEVALGCMITAGGDGFDKDHALPPQAVAAYGVLKNYNTIDEFKNADKKALLNQVADEIWESITTKRDTSALTRFLVITYADLKKYKYYYWFAFPALVAQPLWEIADEWKLASEAFSEAQLSSIHDQFNAQPRAFFLVRPAQTGTGVDLAPVEDYTSFFANISPEARTVAFLDPSPDAQVPGWPLRNLLAYLRAVHPSETDTIRVI